MRKLNCQEQQELLAWARKVLAAYLSTGKIPQENPRRKIFRQKAGVFVTLTRDGQLRGCIGEFAAKEDLWVTVAKMAIEAAAGDPRFSPLTQDELPKIKIEISLLSPLRKISSWRKIALGKDGVLIEKGGRRGTFLPQVATETGWDLETFLSVLCSQKCGLPPLAYQDPKSKIFTYEAQVFGEENREI